MKINSNLKVLFLICTFVIPSLLVANKGGRGGGRRSGRNSEVEREKRGVGEHLSSPQENAEQQHLMQRARATLSFDAKGTGTSNLPTKKVLPNKGNFLHFSLAIRPTGENTYTVPASSIWIEGGLDFGKVREGSIFKLMDSTPGLERSFEVNDSSDHHLSGFDKASNMSLYIEKKGSLVTLQTWEGKQNSERGEETYREFTLKLSDQGVWEDYNPKVGQKRAKTREELQDEIRFWENLLYGRTVFPR